MLKPCMCAAVVVCAILSMPAQAQEHVTGSEVMPHFGQTRLQTKLEHEYRPRRRRNYAGAVIYRGYDYRPRAWCGWWLRMQLGIADRNLNRAIMWARWGRPAGGPHVGAIVVWRHHVGRIVGPCNGSLCLIQSGNDGHAVRTRERS